MAPISPSSCWRKATKFTVSFAAPARSTRGRIDHLYRDPDEAETSLYLHYADLTDSSSLLDHRHRIKPDEVQCGWQPLSDVSSREIVAATKR